MPISQIVKAKVSNPFPPFSFLQSTRPRGYWQADSIEEEAASTMPQGEGVAGANCQQLLLCQADCHE